MPIMTISIDEQAVVDGYIEGESLRELAARFSVSISPIQRVLTKHGITMRERKRGPDKTPRLKRSTARAPETFEESERADIVARFVAGETQVALAKEFRCGASTIGRILRAEGVPAGAHGQLREHHHAWRGGRRMHPDGYVQVMPDKDDEIGQVMRGAGRYVLEHRLVMAHALGRPLMSDEQVHHVDTNRRDDNRIENLQLRLGPHGAGSSFRCRCCGSTDIEAVELGTSETVTL